jgi:hypothetical protein
VSASRDIHSIVCVLLALTPCAMLRAAESVVPPTDAWYRVEVVIFERLGSGSDTSAAEVFVTQAPRAFSRDALAFDDNATRTEAYSLDGETRASITPNAATQLPRTASTPPSSVAPGNEQAAALADHEFKLQQRSFRFEPSSSFLLSPHVARLQRNPGYRVVFHRAWIQPVPDRDQLLPMLIQVGDRAAGGGWRIEGVLGVTRERYLHLDTRLWYALDPGPAGDTTIAFDGKFAESSADGAGYTELREQRRMRSGELHYLDHPKFGVLARVDPVLPP